MKLFYATASPFARKPIVLLHEAKKTDEVELVSVSGSAIDPGTLPTDINPLGKIPTLVLDDGTALFDSDIICRFLADTYAPWLYRGGAATQSLTLEPLGNGMMEAAILIVYEGGLRPKDMQFTPWIEGQGAKITRALDALEYQAADHGSVLCGPPSMGSLTIAIALSYLDFRLPDLGWRKERPRLKAWEADIARRPSLMATTPAD
ncbi:glutathione S-transferase family protein [Loktanella sp. Alg231-35]|uniref:glutathione S-transferase family protein n=1 Tax=Loktanella sp. Alg231-35 TaxID=1922220 RepID=UPI000D54AFCC|nr:glutathione S-transferase family protein [Loktanella sp. Alg231-35]